MTYIAKEYASQTKVYGIDKSEFSKYLKNRNNSTLINSEIMTPWPYSMIKLEIITSGG